jgi:hypothetical protein
MLVSIPLVLTLVAKHNLARSCGIEMPPLRVSRVWRRICHGLEALVGGKGSKSKT